MEYVLDQKHGKYVLKIWEPAPVKGARLLPVLYRLQVSFSSEIAAREYLDRHLEMNQQIIQDELL
jgi:hypothetical protein